MGREKEFALAVDEVLTPIAVESGALEPCHIHSHILIDQFDDVAMSRAYARATIAWKNDEIGGSREDVVEAMANLISSSPDHCTHCAHDMAKD